MPTSANLDVAPLQAGMHDGSGGMHGGGDDPASQAAAQAAAAAAAAAAIAYMQPPPLPAVSMSSVDPASGLAPLPPAGGPEVSLEALMAQALSQQVSHVPQQMHMHMHGHPQQQQQQHGMMPEVKYEPGMQ